jgi:hypothetical protein
MLNAARGVEGSYSLASADEPGIEGENREADRTAPLTLDDAARQGRASGDESGATGGLHSRHKPVRKSRPSMRRRFSDHAISRSM